MLRPSGGRGRGALGPLVGRGRWQIVAQVIAVRVELGRCGKGWCLMARSRLGLGRNLPFVVARRLKLGRLRMLGRALLRRLRRALGRLGNIGERGRCGRVGRWIRRWRGLRGAARWRRIVRRRISCKARIGALILRIRLVVLGWRHSPDRRLRARHGLWRIGLGLACWRRIGLGRVLRGRGVLLWGLRRGSRLPVLPIGLLAGVLGCRRIGLTVDRRLLRLRQIRRKAILGNARGGRLLLDAGAPRRSWLPLWVRLRLSVRRRLTHRLLSVIRILIGIDRIIGAIVCRPPVRWGPRAVGSRHFKNPQTVPARNRRPVASNQESSAWPPAPVPPARLNPKLSPV